MSTLNNTNNVTLYKSNYSALTAYSIYTQQAEEQILS